MALINEIVRKTVRNYIKESVSYQQAVDLINQGFLIHCSPKDFKEFDERFIVGGFRGREGRGFYFSNQPYKPIEYGDYIYVIKEKDFNFLESSAKIDEDMLGLNFQVQLYKLEDMLYNCRTIRDYDEIKSEIEKLKETEDASLTNAIEKAIRNGAKTYGNLEYMIENPRLNVMKLQNIYMKNGYDGYVTDGVIFTVFNTNKLNKYVIKVKKEEI